jgi:sugar phosphate isomerase/epimerase
MLLGYNTWSMPTVDIDTAVAHLAKLGFDSMELTICPGWPTDAALLDRAERRRIKALIRDHGLILTGCTGNTPILVEDDAWAANRRTLESYLQFAADMQEPGERLYISTTSGMPEGADPATAWEECKHLLTERFGQLAAYAAARGVTVHLEPHVSAAACRAEHALWLLDQVGSDAFRISLDISHFEVQGFDYREVVTALAPVAGAVEVKDERGVYPNFEFLIPGEGEMDYAGFLRALADVGYDGSVSVEVSKFRQVIPGYDPLAAAETSYRVLAAAFAKSTVPRRR